MVLSGLSEGTIVMSRLLCRPAACRPAECRLLLEIVVPAATRDCYVTNDDCVLHPYP